MSKPNYDFVKATFFFFQAFGRRPTSVMWIALWQTLAYAFVAGLLLYSVWPLMTLVFETAARGGDPDPADMFAAVGGMGLALFIGVIGSILVALMSQGAWLRLLTRDEVAPGIPFRLGGDEGRLFLVNLIFVGLVTLGYLATILVFVLVNLALGAADGIGGAAARALVNTVLVLIAVAAWIIVMTRFAAAPALTVVTRRFQLPESFAATKGVTGWMVLSYLVLMLIILVAYVVVSMLQNVIFLIGASDALGALMALDAHSDDPEVVFSILADAFSSGGAIAALLVVMVVQIIFQVLYEATWHGVGAYVAVRHVNGEVGVEEPIEAPAASVGAAPSEG